MGGREFTTLKPRVARSKALAKVTPQTELTVKALDPEAPDPVQPAQGGERPLSLVPTHSPEPTPAGKYTGRVHYLPQSQGTRQ